MSVMTMSPLRQEPVPFSACETRRPSPREILCASESAPDSGLLDHEKGDRTSINRTSASHEPLELLKVSYAVMTTAPVRLAHLCVDNGSLVVMNILACTFRRAGIPSKLKLGYT